MTSGMETLKSEVYTDNSEFTAYFDVDTKGTDPENPDKPDNVPDLSLIHIFRSLKPFQAFSTLFNLRARVFSFYMNTYSHRGEGHGGQ